MAADFSKDELRNPVKLKLDFILVAKFIQHALFSLNTVDLELRDPQVTHKHQMLL